MSAVLAALLAGGAALLWTGQGAPAVRRLQPARPAPARGQPPSSLRVPVALRRRAPAAAALVVAGLALTGQGLPAVVAGVALAALVLPDRRRAGAQARAEAGLARDLPAAADLLATCLAAGLAPVDAVRLVADTATGEVRTVLVPVGAALAVGLDPVVAWAPVAHRGDGCARLARAFVRASATGAPLAAVVSAVAEDERERVRWAAEAAARRAGVRAVGPLAVCFLPAFLLVGVVPLVAAVATDVLGTLR